MASKVVIDADFLRKRAEHNEGCLSTLEEIALHQLNIERIENFDKLIRHVKILLLQNNLISKMENLTRLKELNYLNLALNNIEVIEGLEGSESLEKLDMTCNFIRLDRLFQSLVHLKQVKSLREVHFMGNPFTDWKNYRQLVIALVPQLILIDGNEITPTERIQSGQRYEELLTELEQEIVQEEEKQATKTPEEKAKEYTPDSRREMYKEMQKEQEDKERARKGSNKDEEKKKGPTPMYNASGELRQCNEGRYVFKLLEWDDPEWSYFELDVPLYIETSHLKFELFPDFVSVRVKDKLTQVKLWEEIIVADSKVQRSQTTGVLMVTMKKAKFNHMVDMEKRQKKSAEEEKQQVQKVNEANIYELLEKQKAKAALKSKINADPDLDDLPDLE